MSIYSKLVSLILILLMVAQVAISLHANSVKSEREEGGKEYVDFSILSVDWNQSEFTANFSIETGGTPEGIFQVAAIPFLKPGNGASASSGIQERTIYLYFDYQYYSSEISQPMWLALADHIFIELSNRGYSAERITPVNASELRTAMEQDPEGVAIIPSGVLPDTIYPEGNATFIRNWLSGGGCIVWLGDMFGYYVGQSGVPLDYANDMNPGEAGHMSILGRPLIYLSENRDRYASIETPISSALCIKYPYTAKGASLFLLNNMGGEAIGKTSEPNKEVSVAYVPVGNGSAVIFGYGVYNWDGGAASDIAQLAWSGALDRNAMRSGASSMSVSIKPGEKVFSNITVAVDETIGGVQLVAFSKDSWNILYEKHYFDRND
ncbi:MAG: hypothetical protein PHH26_08170 [Candidatus Thermoplasmatota archaeon]|nr:hypothetical protein [Candidatus Thermoplasmatota archaeon]